MNLLQATPQATIDTDYYVNFSAEKYIILCIGYKHNHPCFTFTHKNVLASQYKLFEFKHYRPNGGKFWTSCLGKDIYLAIAKEKLDLILEKGYSYVPVSFQGTKFILNVSGGGSGKWGDYVGKVASTTVNLPKKLLTALADAATTENIDFEAIPAFKDERIVLALQEWEAKQRCVLSVGKKIAVKPGYTFRGADVGVCVITDMPTKWRKSYLCHTAKVPAKAIDWIETAALNQAA